jgi:ubiquinone/menaquinone biosynthesis C-methylase UbiE
MGVELILNSIEILKADLLDDQDKLSEIDYWLRVMNRPQGWHYDMDIIWLLKGLEDAGIKKGDTILDAGAGMGITQFVLAAKGFNVISLDFSPRSNLALAKGIFEIEVIEEGDLSYKHDYIGFVKYDSSLSKEKNSRGPRLYQKVWKIMGRGPRYMLSRMKQQFQNKQNKQININEKGHNHNDFGNIKFIRAAFHDMPLKDEEVDALVSVSAIEHSDPKLMEQNINEMKRVVKEGNPLFITTSGTVENKDWFHEKTQGWCFSKETFSKIIGDDIHDKFAPERAENQILSSDIWRKRIDPYYVNDPDSEFYQGKIQSLPYLPVGIKIIKE